MFAPDDREHGLELVGRDPRYGMKAVDGQLCALVERDPKGVGIAGRTSDECISSTRAGDAHVVRELKYATAANSPIEVKASAAHPFEWWMGGGRSGMVQRAIEQLESAVRNGDCTHDGSHMLTRHVLNARRRLAHGKLALAKENEYSPNKIDGAVAAVLAYQARLDALSRVAEVESNFYVPKRLY